MQGDPECRFTGRLSDRTVVLGPDEHCSDQRHISVDHESVLLGENVSRIEQLIGSPTKFKPARDIVPGRFEFSRSVADLVAGDVLPARFAMPDRTPRAPERDRVKHVGIRQGYRDRDAIPDAPQRELDVPR